MFTIFNINQFDLDKFILLHILLTSLKFPSERENDRQIPFLEILVTRN